MNILERIGDRNGTARLALPSLEDCATAEGEKMNAVKIVKALHHSHPRPNWAYFPELRVGTGYGKDNEQRLDAWAMNLMPSKQLSRYAYEVKVSRSDFLAEIKKPWKRKHALMLSNHFYFAAP